MRRKGLNNQEVVRLWLDGVEGPFSNKTHSLYITWHSPRALYSYGVAVATKPVEGPVLVNTARYSQTTSAHRTLVKVESGYRYAELHFVLAHDAGLMKANSELREGVEVVDWRHDWLDYMPDAYLPGPGEESWVGPYGPAVWRPAATLLRQESDHWLYSHDRGGVEFIALLPHQASTVAEAFEALMPRPVRAATEWRRQGEWFFLTVVPAEAGFDSIHQFWRRSERHANLPTRPGGNPHRCTRLLQKTGRLFVSGTVRHPEHGVLRLGSDRVWEAHHNLALRSFSTGPGGRAAYVD